MRDAFVAALPQAEGLIVTIAQQLEANGEARGVLKGQRKLIQTQRQAKFGQLTQRGLQLLGEANDETLEKYSLRILTAQTIDEVFES